MPKNYYIILGLPSNSSQNDIKAAYRRLAKEFHPDYCGEKNSPFLTTQEAYSVLSDPVRRRTYDLSLQKNQQKREQHGYAEPMREYHLDEIEPLIPDQGPIGLGDVSLMRSFHSYKPSFDSLFDRLSSNFRNKNQPKGERLEDLTVVMTLTPVQAFRGGHVRLNIPARLQCHDCRGHGGVGPYECWRCGGAGSYRGEYPILISYPPGISDKHSVQLSLDRYGIRNLYLTVTFRISEME